VLRNLIRIKISTVIEYLRTLWIESRISQQRQLLHSNQNNLVLHGPIYISLPRSLSLGHHVVLNEGAYFVTEGGLSIGSYVHVARNCTIFTVNHNYRSIKAIPYDESIINKPVIIKDYVWIGANVSIIPGVTIEEGAIVGMGAVVTKDIPKGAIVGGNPAQVIGYRDLEAFERLKREKKYH